MSGVNEASDPTEPDGGVLGRRRRAKLEREEERDWRRKLVLASRKIQQVHLALSEDVADVRDLRARLEQAAPRIEQLDRHVVDSSEHLSGLEQLLQSHGELLRAAMDQLGGRIGQGLDTPERTRLLELEEELMALREERDVLGPYWDGVS